MYSFFNMNYSEMVVSDIPAKLNNTWCVADISSASLYDNYLLEVISDKSDIHIQYNVCDGTPIYLVERIPIEYFNESIIESLKSIFGRCISVNYSEDFVDVSLISEAVYEKIK